MANRSKFTPDRAEVIVEAMRKGHSLRHASGLARIAVTTTYRWLDSGREADAAGEDGGKLTAEQVRYREFYLACEEASAKAAEYALGKVTDAFQDDWRAAMTFLERRFPDEYTKRERREISGPKDGPIEVVVQWPSGTETPR